MASSTAPPDANPVSAPDGTIGTRLSDYDYGLPEGRIALRPAVPRDSAKMLVASPTGVLDAIVADLPGQLAPGDRLVVNNSRVIPARLTGERHREGGVSGIELTLLSEDAGVWTAFAKPAKRLQPGDRVVFGEARGTVLTREGPQVSVRFDGSPLNAGAMPLPPYIAARRAPDAQDETDYQTVYADPAGSVAAPTAGLHFTDELLERLRERGITLTHVTLHVGAGTFLPVTAEDVVDHKMHAEYGEVSEQAVEDIAATRAAGGRIIAAGTTSLRLLEAAAVEGAIKPFAGETDLFIRPGFPFHVADGLITNFHLPRSTLLMLVAAFVGYERMRGVYAHALANGYRFYSYGDASLLWRADG